MLVTADHAHTMSIGGYTSRQSDIAGVVDDHNNDVSDSNIASDGKSFTILSYGNGPGKKAPQSKVTNVNIIENSGFQQYTVADIQQNNGSYLDIDRHPLMESTPENPLDYKQQSAAPLSSETHGGDEVGLWAAGPMAHLVHGTHQQSYIAHLMSYSACIGPHAKKGRCQARVAGVNRVALAPALLLVVLAPLRL